MTSQMTTQKKGLECKNTADADDNPYHILSPIIASVELEDFNPAV